MGGACIVAFYVSWNHEFEKTDLGRQEIDCVRCGSKQIFTIRLYVDKTKLYGLATIRKKRFITLVCHGCLTEFEALKEYQENILQEYDNAVETAKKEEKAARQVKR